MTHIRSRIAFATAVAAAATLFVPGARTAAAAASTTTVPAFAQDTSSHIPKGTTVVHKTGKEIKRAGKHTYKALKKAGKQTAAETHRTGKHIKKEGQRVEKRMAGDTTKKKP